MALVQIEDSELAALKRERDEAKASADKLKDDNRELTTKVETAEAAKVAAETAKTEAEAKVTKADEAAAAVKLRDDRLGKLGAGFMAKLGDTSKTVLTELASKASDDEWELALKEREELAKAKRDEAASTTTPPAGGEGDTTPAAGSSFESEEVASFLRSGVATPASATATPDGASSVRSLARSFGKPKTAAPAAK